MAMIGDLFTPNSRSRLKALPGRFPHWYPLARGRALGYRPHESDASRGTWVARCRVAGESKYRQQSLGEADSPKLRADGESVLDFNQALAAAQIWCEDQERIAQGQEPKDRLPYTVERAMADYLDWSRAHRKAPQQVEQVTKNHILPALGDVEVADLTAGKIRRWHQKIAETPPMRRSVEGGEQNLGELDGPEARRKRKSTANRVLAVLKAGLNMAYREGRAASNRAWSQVKPFKGVDRPKVRFLEEEEAVRLLNACSPDFRKIVRGALLTGCRYGELCRLRVGDFKLTPMPMVLLEDTKSHKSRHVYLNDEGAAFFGKLAAGRKNAEPMFLRTDGQTWGRSHQARRMEAASEDAGIDPSATFHELRHTYASHYLMNGGDLPGLSQQLGHADTRMTLRHYAHLADRWRAEQARLHVPSFGGGGSESDGGRLVEFRAGQGLRDGEGRQSAAASKTSEG